MSITAAPAAQVTVETVETVVGETGKALLDKAAKCANPKAVHTDKVINYGKGPKIYCTGCEAWQPAAQVPWGQELRNRNGFIIGSYAALAH